MNTNPNTKRGIDNLLIVGNVRSKILLTVLFYTGLLGAIYYSVGFGKYIAATNMMMTSVLTTEGMYSGELVENMALGYLAGILFFVVVVIVWRVICELLLLIFNALERFR